MAFRAWEEFLKSAHGNGNRTAVICGDNRATFADLAASARKWASTIAAADGERVILYGENSVALIGAVLGIWKTGAIPVWVNAGAPTSHLRLAVEETDAVCVISEKPELSRMINCRVVGEALDEHDALPQPSSNEIGSIVYTSGSTGRPKGVVQKATTLVDGAERVARALGYRDDDSILCPVPFAFDYGWGQLLSLLFRGVTLVLPRPNNAFGICEAIARHRPTVFAGVPAVYANLLSGLSPIRTTDCTSVRLLTNSGSRIPKEVQNGMLAVFSNAALSLNYGLTETYRTATLPVPLATIKSHAVGSALPGVEIVILDESGQRCKPDEVGQIVHIGAGVFEGYWKNPDRTASVRKPDPLDPASGRMAVFTGDLGYVDADGHLVIVGRADRQIKSMGVRVSPDEIEDILLATGHVAEVAVTSRPDDLAGELVVAFVVPKSGDDTEAMLKKLKQDSRADLSPYMTPRVYHLLESMPRNSNGKVDYVALKQVAADRTRVEIMPRAPATKSIM